MRRCIWFLILGAVAFSGCGLWPWGQGLRTRDITFYRDVGVNDEWPISFRIISPRNEKERQAVLTAAEDYWFDSAESEEMDLVSINGQVRPNELMMVALTAKTLDVIVVAKFGERSEDRALQLDDLSFVHLYKGADRKPRRHEHIWIHQGYMRRLNKAPKGYVPFSP